jgi:hypothetical protein
MANETKTQCNIKGGGAAKKESQTAKQAFVRCLARLQKEWGCPKKKGCLSSIILGEQPSSVYSGLVIDKHIIPTFHNFLPVVELDNHLCAVVTDNNSIIPTFVRHQQGATATDNISQLLVV